MIRLLTVVFFVEVGLVLAVVPWSLYWERNFFAALLPALHAVMINTFFRGAVSGLGVINLAAAISELRALLAGRRVGAVMSLRDSPVEE
jgi:hypothetical protein